MPHPITKILTRETATYYRGRPLVLELHPGYLVLRQKGKRHRVSVEYGAILEFGYKILARIEKANKAEARRAKGRKR